MIPVRSGFVNGHGFQRDMAASFSRSVNTVHISSVIPNLANYLSKRCPHVKFINIPVGCSEGRRKSRNSFLNSMWWSKGLLGRLSLVHTYDITGRSRKGKKYLVYLLTYLYFNPRNLKMHFTSYSTLTNLSYN